jgi:[ribosomal protein S5]-alanine N-acetyltransferase
MPCRSIAYEGRSICALAAIVYATGKEERMTVLETSRLRLRRLAATDAPFIVELLNDPDWLRYIGDRGVRSEAQAIAYVENGPARSYAEHGFGLALVELKTGGEPIGLCGLIKRDFLDDVDLGFAFLPRFRGAGFAFEAGAGVLRDAGSTLGLRRVVAITALDNAPSIRLLERLGFRFERTMPYPGEDEPVRLFGCALPSSGDAAAQP